MIKLRCNRVVDAIALFLFLYFIPQIGFSLARRPVPDGDQRIVSMTGGDVSYGTSGDLQFIDLMGFIDGVISKTVVDEVYGAIKLEASSRGTAFITRRHVDENIDEQTIFSFIFYAEGFGFESSSDIILEGHLTGSLTTGTASERRKVNITARGTHLIYFPSQDEADLNFYLFESSPPISDLYTIRLKTRPEGGSPRNPRFKGFQPNAKAD